MFSGWNKTSLTREILQLVLENSRSSCRSNQQTVSRTICCSFYFRKISWQSTSDHTTLKNSKEVRIIDLIHQLHFTININDYYLHLETWEELMVLSFTMNKQNYARYGTYYLTQMGSLDSTHPGAHEEIQEKGISVCRNSTGVWQSIDGTGEQTFMRNSKTAGNYISFLMCSGCSYLFLFWGGKYFFVFNSWASRNCLISNRMSLCCLSLYYLIEANYLGV